MNSEWVNRECTVATYSWLQEITLDDLTAAWHEAQRLKTIELETHKQRVADPFDMTGKPPGYVRPQSKQP